MNQVCSRGQCTYSIFSKRFCVGVHVRQCSKLYCFQCRSEVYWYRDSIKFALCFMPPWLDVALRHSTAIVLNLQFCPATACMFVWRLWCTCNYESLSSICLLLTVGNLTTSRKRPQQVGKAHMHAGCDKSWRFRTAISSAVGAVTAAAQRCSQRLTASIALRI